MIRNQLQLEVIELSRNKWHEDVNVMRMTNSIKLKKDFKFDLRHKSNGEKMCFQIRMVSQEGARELIFYHDGIKSGDQWMKDQINFSWIEVNANEGVENSREKLNVNANTIVMNMEYSIFITAQTFDKDNVFLPIFQQYLGKVKFVKVPNSTTTGLSVRTAAKRNAMLGAEVPKKRGRLEHGTNQDPDPEEPFLMNENAVAKQEMKYPTSAQHHCCNEDHFLALPNFFCDTRTEGGYNCRINENDEFYARNLKNNKKSVFCAKCFEAMKGSVEDGKWVKNVHHHRQKEFKMKCIQCHNWAHVICAGFNLKDDPNTFKCNKCAPPKKLLASEVLGKNRLTDYMEEYMKPTLVEHKCDSFTFVRLIASGESNGHGVARILARWFQREEVDLVHPFIYKHIGLYQVIDGQEELVFAVIVREFVAEGRKKGTTFLYYLDSNDACRPNKQKGLIYKTFLAAYWSYAQSIGFWRCFVNLSAPKKGDCFLFSERPRNQYYLSDEQLFKWYSSCIELAQENKMKTIELPSILEINEKDTTRDLIDELYFEDSDWPGLMLKSLEDEEDFKSFVKEKSKEWANWMFFINFTSKRPDEIRISDPDPLQPIGFSALQGEWLILQKNLYLQFDTPRRRKYSTQILTQCLHRALTGKQNDQNQPSTSRCTR